MFSFLKRYARFSLRFLLIVFFLAAVAFAWMANCSRRQALENEAVEVLKEQLFSRFTILYDYQFDANGELITVVPGKPGPEPFGPKWIRRFYGEHIFSRVVSVSCGFSAPKAEVLNATLPKLSALKTLRFRPRFSLPPEFRIDELASLEELVGPAVNDMELEKIGRLKNLKKLTLSSGRNARFNGDIPTRYDHLGSCRNLTHLSLAQTSHMADLAWISNLKQLQNFELKGASRLDSLEPLTGLNQLTELRINGSSEIDSLEPLRELTNLRLLNIHDVPRVKSLESLAGLQKLEELILSELRSVDSISPLGELPKLSKLWLSVSDRVSDLNVLGRLSGLTAIDCLGSSVENLSFAKELGELKSLNLTGSEQLTDLAGIQNCKQLEKLNLTGCEQVTNLTPLSSLSNLKLLFLGRCSRLESLDGLQPLKMLRLVDAKDCRALRDTNAVSGLPPGSLVVSGCRSLENLDFLARNTWEDGLEVENFEQAKSFNTLPRILTPSIKIANCPKLKSLGRLDDNAVPSIVTQLQIEHCPQLTDVQGLGPCPGLTELRINHSPHQKLLKQLTAKSLNLIQFDGCNINNLNDLEEFSNLQNLTFANCKNLVSLQGIDRCKAADVKIEACPKLKDVSQLKRCTYLSSIVINDCDALKELEIAGEQTRVTRVMINDCDSLEAIQGLGELTSMYSIGIDLKGCKKLQSLGDLSELSIRELRLPEGFLATGQYSLPRNIVGIHLDTFDDLKFYKNLNRSSVSFLKIKDCRGLNSLEELAMPNLKMIRLENAVDLEDVSAVEQLANLTSIEIFDATKLKTLWNGNATLSKEFWYVQLSGCAQLDAPEVVNQLSQIKSLRRIGLSGSLADEMVAARHDGFKGLKLLHLTDCSQLESVDQLDHIRLDVLSLTGCEALKQAVPMSVKSNLETLTIMDCPHVEDLASLNKNSILNRLTISGPRIPECVNEMTVPTQMRTLTFIDCPDLLRFNIDYISNGRSISIKNCPNLKSLSAASRTLPFGNGSLGISNCPRIDAKDLEKLKKQYGRRLNVNAN